MPLAAALRLPMISSHSICLLDTALDMICIVIWYYAAVRITLPLLLHGYVGTLKFGSPNPQNAPPPLGHSLVATPLVKPSCQEWEYVGTLKFALWISKPHKSPPPRDKYQLLCKLPGIPMVSTTPTMGSAALHWLLHYALVDVCLCHFSCFQLAVVRMTLVTSMMAVYNTHSWRMHWLIT